RAAGARARLRSRMSETVVIERRFCGPPGVAHGGYACGLIAERLQAACVEVSLRAPAPLERPLTVERDGDGVVRLRAGEELVAEGRPAGLRLDVPGPVPATVAHEAAAHCPWTERHPFPECFGCGPARSQDE